jgi:pyruvate dehydrogenase E2 component (dihydrolipoamide acetyltransferase)
MRGEVVQQTAMRRAIARRMSESKRDAPHFYVSSEIRMDRVEEALTAAAGEHPDQRITATAALVRAAAISLRREPALNRVWTQDGLLDPEEVNVGVAIALDEGLIAPALLAADRLDLVGTAAALGDLVARARAQRLRPAELTDATFTLSNLGMFEVSSFAAIVTPPQVAILATGRAIPRPFPTGDGFEAVPVMTATLSADHRAVDGRDAAQFLESFKRVLEEPGLLLATANTAEVATS